jgi:hypothetical protein
MEKILWRINDTYKKEFKLKTLFKQKEIACKTLL